MLAVESMFYLDFMYPPTWFGPYSLAASLAADELKAEFDFACPTKHEMLHAKAKVN